MGRKAEREVTEKGRSGTREKETEREIFLGVGREFRENKKREEGGSVAEPGGRLMVFLICFC